MDRPEFVYTTYAMTTRERLWQALTDPSFTQRWWEVTSTLDWQVGSIMSWESEPYHRLIYTIYITTTPERLWHALTDPSFSRRWGTTSTSDWQVGSIMSWQQEGVIIAGPAQVVVASEPSHRLIYTMYTWHTYIPELACLLGNSDAFSATISREPRSRVAFTLEPIGQMVELTIVQDDFDSPSTVMQMPSNGWPQFLSSLKTRLETGQTVATSA